jgi:hypothetical protein
MESPRFFKDFNAVALEIRLEVDYVLGEALTLGPSNNFTIKLNLFYGIYIM